MRTIQQLAAEAKRFMTRVEPGENDRRKADPGLSAWRCFSDEAPDWTTDLSREAHGGMFPDDWRYEFVSDALSAISECDEDASADDIRESAQGGGLHEYVYTSEATGWLHSRNDRLEYVGRFVSDFGADPEDFNALLFGGLRVEQEEVFEAVLSFLERLAEEDDSEAAD